MTNRFKSYYINIIEKSSDTKPKTFRTNFETTSAQSVRDIANCYKNHPSIIKIKEEVNGSDVFNGERLSFKTANEVKLKIFRKIST